MLVGPLKFAFLLAVIEDLFFSHKKSDIFAFFFFSIDKKKCFALAKIWTLLYLSK